ncbi:hypothetical protein SLE2022_107400 [Rubroshorea leprosula]
MGKERNEQACLSLVDRKGPPEIKRETTLWPEEIRIHCRVEMDPSQCEGEAKDTRAPTTIDIRLTKTTFG